MGMREIVPRGLGCRWGERGRAMKIAVTGAAGFVGSAVCRDALSRGLEVRGVDDLSTGRKEWVPEGVELQVCDAGCPEARYDDVDAVIHCAAIADISRNWESM